MNAHSLTATLSTLPPLACRKNSWSLTISTSWRSRSKLIPRTGSICGPHPPSSHHNVLLCSLQLSRSAMRDAASTLIPNGLSWLPLSSKRDLWTLRFSKSIISSRSKALEGDFKSKEIWDIMIHCVFRLLKILHMRRTLRKAWRKLWTNSQMRMQCLLGDMVSMCGAKRCTRPKHRLRGRFWLSFTQGFSNIF